MSVETNENDIITKNNLIKKAVNAENTGGNKQNNKENQIKEKEKTKVIDIQATQRIDFLGELKKETVKSVEQIVNVQQGDFAPKNNEINELESEKNVEKNNIENSNSEISTESIAQAQNSSVNFILKDNVQEIPNEENTINNIENTQTDIANDENKLNIDNIVNNDEVSGESKQEAESITENIEDSEEVLKRKEKQHAQDKKDYRLERMLFDRINKMQGKIKESLELIKKFERINAKEENLPNIVTTLHDKLTHEVIKQFRTVGIEFNMKSYLVQAVVSDLLGKFEEGITEFKDCSENLNFVREVQEDFESRVELAPTSKVKNFFAKLRGMFKPERKQERLAELERERQEKKLEEANIHLIKYKFINSELEKYTIRKNIVNSLTKEILHGQGSGLTLNVNEFISEKIEPEMKKLGLENSLSNLNDKIFEEYKLKDEKISKEDFEKLSIGEIRKNIKFAKIELIKNKINTVVTSDSGDSEERMVV